MKQDASTLRDIMSTDVVTVAPDATLRQVAELFTMQGISGAPVVSDGRVLGVISATDILDFAAYMPGTLPDEPAPAWRTSRSPTVELAPESYAEWATKRAGIQERLVHGRAVDGDVLHEHTVRDLMTSSVRSLSPDSELHEAASYMLKHGIHRVLVMDGEELVGVVSTLDFLRAVAERRL